MMHRARQTWTFAAIGLALLYMATSAAQAVEPNAPIAEPLQVYLFAGQSNMQGTGVNSELIGETYNTTRQDIWFWGDNAVGWEALAPGKAVDADHFGPELIVGQILADRMPDQQVALIKHAVSTTNLAEDWNPDTPGPQYSDFLGKVDQALTALTDAGYTYEINGFFWRQGERDSRFENMAAAYEVNFTNFVSKVRQQFSDPSLPFVFGRIKGPTDTNPDWLNMVRDAQTAVAASVPNVYMVNTDSMELIDDCHYNTRGHIMQGEGMAAAYFGDYLEFAEIVNSNFENGLNGWTASGAGNGTDTYADIQTFAPGFTGWEEHFACIGYGQSSPSSIKQILDGSTPAILEVGKTYSLEVRVGRPGTDTYGYSNEFGWRVALETEDGTVLDSIGYGDVPRIDPLGWYIAEVEYTCLAGDPLIGQYLVVALYHDDALGRGSGIYDDVVLRMTPEPATIGIMALGTGGLLLLRKKATGHRRR